MSRMTAGQAIDLALDALCVGQTELAQALAGVVRGDYAARLEHWEYQWTNPLPVSPAEESDAEAIEQLIG
jgi:hypothetical protein